MATLLTPPSQGLVAAIQQAAGAALGALVDFQQEMVLRSYFPPPVTDEDVRGLITEYSADDIDERLILRSDRRVLIQASTVTSSISTDVKLRVGEVELDIIDVSIDPAGAIYQLQVRKTST